ncbi:MAG: hypothetical protein IJ137_04000 [Eubacterium sp.]|nr:hypothetical protein [Eubacterium sp.]
MRNPFLKVQLLIEGRNMRLPLTVIFYNAILAFMMILFMVLNSETFQDGYYYDTLSYIHQFLILSSIQLGSVFVLMPFYVSSLFLGDRENHMMEQFAMIPGVNRQFIQAKIGLVLMNNSLLFISGIPIVGLSCVYTGLSFAKMIRLGLMVLLFSFWSGAVAIFFYSVSGKQMWSFAGTLTAHLVFFIGTIVVIELLRNGSLLATRGISIPEEVSWICLLLLTLNPLASYMGYYGNITGDNELISVYCSHFGIDASGRMFSLLFFKGACLACIVTAVIFLILAVRNFKSESSL